ncbi:MAG: CAP domain-containing protein [Bifidobacteriaceae bacterium]|nr:CAP domain-containing protein [Bifidobacteriaceae bacterium]
MTAFNKAVLAMASGAAALFGASLVSGTVSADELPAMSPPSPSQQYQSESAEPLATNDDAQTAPQTQESQPAAQATQTQVAQAQTPAAKTQAPVTKTTQAPAAQKQVPAPQTKESASAPTATQKSEPVQAQGAKGPEDASAKDSTPALATATKTATTKSPQQTNAPTKTVNAKTTDTKTADAKAPSATTGTKVTEPTKSDTSQTKVATVSKAVVDAQSKVTKTLAAKKVAQSDDDAAAANLKKVIQTATAAASTKPADTTGASTSTVGFFNKIGSAATLLTDPSYQPWLKQHPEWEKLGVTNDSTTMANMLASVEGLRELNKLRASLGLGQLKVSAWLTADAQSHADYSGGEYWDLGKYSHANQDYPNLPLNSAENIAIDYSWAKAYKAWYDDEKVIWDAAAAKNPKLTSYLSDPSGAYKLYKSNNALYEQVGHYLNIIDPTLKVMGMAQSYSARMGQFSYSQDMSYAAIKGEKLYTVDEWEALVRSAIHANATKAVDVSSNAKVKAATAAKKSADAKLAAATSAFNLAESSLASLMRAPSSQQTHSTTKTPTTPKTAKTPTVTKTPRTVTVTKTPTAPKISTVPTTRTSTTTKTPAASHIAGAQTPVTTHTVVKRSDGGSNTTRSADASAKAKLYAAIHSATKESAKAKKTIDHTEYAEASDGTFTALPHTGANVAVIAALMVSAALAEAGSLGFRRHAQGLEGEMKN